MGAIVKQPRNRHETEAQLPARIDRNADGHDAPLRWDMACRVIDNFGDIGFCWRLGCALAARGRQVRLWADDASALAWMAPAGHAGVEVHGWPSDSATLRGLAPPEVLVEAFGCEPPAALSAMLIEAKNAVSTGASATFPSIINLEHLTAERFAERAHRLPSPIQSGPGRGLIRHFFYPGFTPATGGLLREDDLLERQASFQREPWLQSLGIAPSAERLVSLFSYEPPALAALLNLLARAQKPTRLLVTDGRSAAAVRALLGGATERGALRVSFLPRLVQPDFDHLLWASELNFVRGEDSLVRALWAARPFVWQAYPQHDGAHAAKVEALLRWLQAPPSLAAWHRVWNDEQVPPALSDLDLAGWRVTARAARERLLQQPDLVTQLIRFAAGKS